MRRCKESRRSIHYRIRWLFQGVYSLPHLTNACSALLPRRPPKPTHAPSSSLSSGDLYALCDQVCKGFTKTELSKELKQAILRLKGTSLETNRADAISGDDASESGVCVGQPRERSGFIPMCLLCYAMDEVSC
jgi:hypothetical protein